MLNRRLQVVILSMWAKSFDLKQFKMPKQHAFSRTYEEAYERGVHVSITVQ